MAAEYLKSSYKWTLWAFAVANVAIFWAVVIVRDVSDIGSLFSTLSAKDATFAGLAPIAMLILNGLLSADNKARAVHWRLKHPLPGCFAFSKFLAKEPRADSAVLSNAWGELPSDPAAQNELWYRMYRAVDNEVRIHESHRDSLFSRDLTGYALIFLVVFGFATLFSSLPWPTTSGYIAFLVLQYVAVMWAARVYGQRLVCNVLAEQSANPRTGG